MRTAATLGVFAAGLTAIFSAAYLTGAAVPPMAEGSPANDVRTGHEEPHSGHPAAADTSLLPGLSISQEGYTLSPVSTVLPSGQQVPLRFSIVGPDGRPVTSYTESHTKELHLVMVRRDLSIFQHVHPARDAEGIWTVPVDVGSAGSYRIFADFTPGALDHGVVLGADIDVSGMYEPAALPTPTDTASVGGYEVKIDGVATVGKTSLTFTVRHGGVEIASLEPYLGAFGHLVSLRTGDLAYLHTHPTEEAAVGTTGGPTVQFGTVFPSAGTYRLFLDFKVDGAVHTAAFTLQVPASPATVTAPVSTGDMSTEPSATVQPSVEESGAESGDGHGH